MTLSLWKTGIYSFPINEILQNLIYKNFFYHSCFRNPARVLDCHIKTSAESMPLHDIPLNLMILSIS